MIVMILPFLLLVIVVLIFTKNKNVPLLKIKIPLAILHIITFSLFCITALFSIEFKTAGNFAPDTFLFHLYSLPPVPVLLTGLFMCILWLITLLSRSKYLNIIIGSISIIIMFFYTYLSGIPL